MIFKNNNGSYVCEECGVKFDSRGQGEAHLILHYKLCCKKHDSEICDQAGMGYKRDQVCCDNCPDL